MGHAEFMDKSKKIVIIGGCGRVGVPLGSSSPNCGLDVVLLDRDQSKIETVNSGQMPFMETNALEQQPRLAIQEKGLWGLRGKW